MLAYYDLQTSPPTYDIVAFLCAVERWRQRRGGYAVEIQILPGPAHGFRQDRLWPFTTSGRRQMLEQVALPMARMLPGAEVMLCTQRPALPVDRSALGYLAHLYGLRLQVDTMRDGIRPLRPAGPTMRHENLVTITLREAEHWPGRNSKIEEWRRAAHAIRSRGYHVCVIRDTSRAAEPLDDFEIDPQAAADLECRACLYRSAACNLFVNNGPAWFSLALDAPTVIVRPVTVGGAAPCCSFEYFRQCGIEGGGQIPGAPKYQRLAWVDDREAGILSAFDEFMRSR